MTTICPTCGDEFERKQYGQRHTYCSQLCATKGSRLTLPGSRRGEKPAIVPTAMQPGRARPMQEDELTMYLARETREIEAAGRPTHDPGWRHRRASVRQNER